MSGPIAFTLDGKTVTAAPGETLFQVAQREGIKIPHLCSEYHHGSRADGNCRLCVVEITGERVLAPSCLRKPEPGMAVETKSKRVTTARRMVMELLLADMPPRDQGPDPDSHFWAMADKVGTAGTRFPARAAPKHDASHPALAVSLNACIHCTNCVRACGDIQVNNVLGMAARGARSTIVFDQADPAVASTCVACGECVQSCPTGALLPRDPLTGGAVCEAMVEKRVDSLCPFCGVGCQVSYALRNDRIVRVDGLPGPANDGRLCVKGRFGFDYINHPHRLTKPLIRKPGVPKRAGDRVDPANPGTHFREASWEEALEKAARGFMRLRDRNGADALAGFGSAKGSNEEAYLFQKLVRTGFGTNNVDHCTRLCHASSVAALMEGIGTAAVSAPFNDALLADVIIVIGARPNQNHPVAASFIKSAAKAGKHLIVMDPRGQGLTPHARHHLRFKPGMDVALLNALLHTIITEGLTDADYIAAHTQDYEALKARIADFSPEAMAPVCGIDADTIREVARAYATAERSIIFWGMGVSQHVHGTDNARCLISLALCTGQIGRPGTGLHPLRGQNNVQGASDAGLIPMVFPDYQPVSDRDNHAFWSGYWQAPLHPEKGLTVVEIMHGALAGSIRGMYVMGENPAMSDPDAAKARAGLANLEHLVVQDIFLTETAAHADVILPASAFPEKTGTFTNTNRQVQMGRAVVAPPGDARQDLWIINALARRLGLDWHYAHPKTVFDEMRGGMPSLDGITWEDLARDGAATYPHNQAVLFGEGFPTEDGRGRFVPTDIVPPDELPDDSYPLVLSTGRLLEHWHTGAMTRRSTVLEALEPQPTASLHPRQLGDLGVSAGAEIRLTSRRGTVVLQARADRDVPVGMVFVPFCYTEAAANLLTNPKLDPFGKIPEFKVCAVRAEAV
ncbi:MAG: formate dehydrogenase subunit alpha [Magnetospiraceae bacterium]